MNEAEEGVIRLGLRPRRITPSSISKILHSGAPRAKRACGAPWVNKSTHPRKFGNHVTDRPSDQPTDRPSVRTTGIPMFTLTLSSYVGSPGESWLHTGAYQIWWAPAAHQCCHRLTAVKTGYPLTSITWPYRGLRCRPIKVECFFEVMRWQFTRFQMIAGSRLLFLNSYQICCVYVSIVPHY